MDKYEALLGEFQTKDRSDFVIRQYEDSNSGYCVDIDLMPDDQFWEAADLRKLAKHLKKLAKQIEAKEAESY